MFLPLAIAALAAVAAYGAIECARDMFRRAHMRRMIADMTGTRWKHKWEAAHTAGFWRARTR